MTDLTNTDVIAAWSEIPLEHIENFGDEGDLVRRVLQSVLEPQLDKAIADQHHAERYWSVPGYLIVTAQKQS